MRNQNNIHLNDSLIKKTEWIVLLFTWAIVTIINLNKAYHIDDTFHLTVAQWIQNNPLQPMSGEINWYNSPSPFYEFNQPPLFFYLLALWGHLFGFNELSTHLLIAIFSFFALYNFLKLAKLLLVKRASYLILLVGFCPAFIINQNVMTDIPILAISLASLYYLLLGNKTENSKYYLLSITLICLGLLIKYSLFPFLVVFAINMLVQQKPKFLSFLLIPITVIAAWSIWNSYEFGSLHLFNRPVNSFNYTSIIAFTSTLGAITCYLLFILNQYFSRILLKITCIVTLLFLPILMLLHKYYPLSDWQVEKILIVSFLINGTILVLYVIVNSINNYRENVTKTIYSHSFILLTYLVGMTLFFILFAPFQATRHVLLIIPIILLLIHQIIDHTPQLVRITTAIITISLGLLLGISDWIQADFYRSTAKEIKSTEQKWTIGHWGWQWYAEQNNIKSYSDADSLQLKQGDLFVIPSTISTQKIQPIELEQVDQMIGSADFGTYFSGKKFASLYNSFHNNAPWTLSNIPIDTITIYRVKSRF